MLQVLLSSNDVEQMQSTKQSCMFYVFIYTKRSNQSIYNKGFIVEFQTLYNRSIIFVSIKIVARVIRVP